MFSKSPSLNLVKSFSKISWILCPIWALNFFKFNVLCTLPARRGQHHFPYDKFLSARFRIRLSPRARYFSLRNLLIRWQKLFYDDLAFFMPVDAGEAVCFVISIFSFFLPFEYYPFFYQLFKVFHHCFCIKPGDSC